MKELKTIGDVLQDEIFHKLLTKTIDRLISDMRNRPEPKPGFVYRKSWVDTMHRQGTLTPAYFLSNIADVWTKKSNLNSKTRGAIELVCNNVLAQTRAEYIRLAENG